MRCLMSHSSHLDHTPGYLEPGLEADLHKPSKPGGIVISDRLGVTEGFQDCVGFQDLLLDPGGDVSSHTEIKILIFSISLHFNFGGRN